MQVKQDTYPIFEPNQVLTNRHLNQVFDYLDEQARLTRANLIGIGVVCGLEIQLAANGKSITLTKGCGVTSQGYLLVEPPLEETATQQEEVSLVEYKTYQLPDEVEEYLPFKFDGTDINGNAIRIQYPLWELFEAGEQGSTKLADAPTGFLNDKAVLLFLELKKDGLRNCSPNNCDDKGFEVVTTVRRLLIQRSDLDKIIAKTNGLNTDITPADLEASLSKRINLPDLRLPRFNVPNSNPTTSNQIFAAFFEVFHTHKLAKNLLDTLNAAYVAFQPILEKQYPSNPFGSFSANFGFLDSAPQNAAQVRFLQYYYDFFDDIVKAYDEFRWKGLELMCACCPPAELFPRHLMLGVLNPPANTNAAIYRHLFLSSSAISGCEEHTADVVHLFQRLVEMTNRFTIAPPLPTQPKDTTNDVQIRITPSKLADVKPSDKAIPYYYLQNGVPSLYKLWNAKKSRQNRAHLNLSYRSDEYANPAAPAFVRQPLQYDLEPYNFLRIEGHLGKNYQSVLNTLLSLKTQYRLPIDIIALRSGIFDETQPVDLSKENCRFDDLEALYEAQKADLIGFLCKEVQYFYDVFWYNEANPTKAKPKLKLLADCAPDYQYTTGTMGHFFELWTGGQNRVPDIDPNIILNFINNAELGQNDWIVWYVLIYLTKFYEQLPANLTEINWNTLDKSYKDLINVAKAVETEREQNKNQTMNWEEIDDRLEDILYKCALEPLKAIHKELETRIKQIKQKQFLSFFLRDNPGIQHKAGVPLGGTFILVYHDDPEPVVRPFTAVGNLAFLDVIGLNTATIANNFSFNRANNLNVSAVNESLTRITANQQLLLNQDIRFLVGTLTGNIPIKDITPAVIVNKDADQVIAETVDGLSDGTVIADFFVPYLCCTGCSSVQFVLPKLPPTFSTEIGCTNLNGEAEVTIKAEGGVAPYSVKVDNGLFTPLTGAILINSGAHNLSIKDSEGTESGIQTVQIAVKLDLNNEKLTCISNNSEFLAEYTISGGTPPYKANRGTISGGDKYISDPIPSDTEATITITDKKDCTVSRKVRHLCVDPLVFSEALGCTGADGASLTIKPSGGVAPYQVKVDAGNYINLADLKNLTVGSHSVILRDSRGTEVAKTIAVPLPLALKVLSFQLDPKSDTGAVFARMEVSGGTVPYTVKGTQIAGAEFSTDSGKNGDVVTVEVIDAKNCSIKQDVTLAFEAPCDLPCKGLSRRGEYRLWVQPADPQREILYRDYSSEGNVKFRYNGKELPLEISSLRDLRAENLNEDYHTAIGRIAAELTKAVAKAIGQEGLLVFSYQKETQLPFRTMQIEYFECEKFMLEFEYTFMQRQFEFTYQVRYSNEVDPVTKDAFDGAVISNLKSKKTMPVPAFGINTRNQCKNGNFEPVCINRTPKVDFKGEQGDILVKLTGNVTPISTKVVAWVWDIPLAEEAFFVGEQITVRPQASPKETPVRLTAITDSGCFGFIDKTML